MWMGEERGPVLVEANMGRWDGSDTKLITDVCFGGNAYDATFAALLEPSGDAWSNVRPMPPAQLPCAGLLVELVSHVCGPLVRVRGDLEAGPHIPPIRALGRLLHLLPRAFSDTLHLRHRAIGQNDAFLMFHAYPSRNFHAIRR